jgi:hypothetical protein
MVAKQMAEILSRTRRDGHRMLWLQDLQCETIGFGALANFLSAMEQSEFESKRRIAGAFRKP